MHIGFWGISTHTPQPHCVDTKLLHLTHAYYSVFVLFCLLTLCVCVCLFVCLFVCWRVHVCVCMLVWCSLSLCCLCISSLPVVGVKLDLEAWTDKFKILASNHTDNRQGPSTVPWWLIQQLMQKKLLHQDIYLPKSFIYSHNVLLFTVAVWTKQRLWNGLWSQQWCKSVTVWHFQWAPWALSLKAVVNFVSALESQSGVRGPPGVFEGVPRGPQLNDS